MRVEIKRIARAGTLESSDILITVKPAVEGIEIQLESDVGKQFGKQIKKVIYDVVRDFNIDNIFIKAQDKGALDYAIRARTETALSRALGLKEEV